MVSLCDARWALVGGVTTAPTMSEQMMDQVLTRLQWLILLLYVLNIMIFVQEF